ncbi:MAG: hypothetical protein ACJ76B_11100 [Solirubrobacterales bacterium]
MLGCGGSDDASSEPLTKRAFLKQGNSICEKGVKEKDKLFEASFKEISAGGKEPAKKDVEQLVLDILPPIQKTTEQLAELSPPEKDEGKVSALIEGYEEAVQEAEEDPGSALSANFMKAPNEAAQTYGFTSCAL